MYDINQLQIGDIMICGHEPNRQMFYIHNIDKKNKIIYSSGINEYDDRIYFKHNWNITRKASEEEERRFYQLIEERGLKFNRNTGVSIY